MIKNSIRFKTVKIQKFSLKIPFFVDPQFAFGMDTNSRQKNFKLKKNLKEILAAFAFFIRRQKP